jgi:hypothetical protein
MTRQQQQTREPEGLLELAPLIARAKAAGLDMDTIAAFACGKEAV